MSDNNPLYAAVPSVINAGFASAESRKERDFAREMYDRQLADQWDFTRDAQDYNTEERIAAQDWEYAMWNRTNQYNSPSAQVARMMQAGINPNTAVASLSSASAASPLSSSGASSPLAAAPSPTGHQAFLPQVSELGLVASQIGLNEATKQGQIISNNYADDMNVATIGQIKQATALAAADEQYKKSMKDLTDKEVSWYDDLQELAINEGSARIDQLNAAIAQAEEEIEMMEEQEETERRKRQSMDVTDAATRDVSAAQVNNLNAGAENQRSQAHLNDMQSITEGDRQRNIEEDTLNKHEDRLKKVYERKCRENDLNPDDPFVWRCIGKVISTGTKNRRRIVGNITSTLNSAKRGLIRAGVNAVMPSDNSSRSRSKQTIISPKSLSVMNPR